MSGGAPVAAEGKAAQSPRMRVPSVITLVAACVATLGRAEPLSVDALTEKCRPSVVKIHQSGRSGGEGGVGSGFVVREDGLIATNFHVIGTGRALSVELADGTRKPATAVHAWNRHLDLAVVKIDATGLPVLPLADSDAVKDGMPLAALGAPRGLGQSVVQGVLSARREIEEFPGVQLLQIAMPVEPGNSGGPLLDMEGRVLGLVTLKSLRAESLGFAMPVNLLKVLLEKPNTIPMARWTTIGALDSRAWQALGAEWTQRAGEIRAEGRGDGFGGRALCISTAPPPGGDYDVAVRVKLNDETGAAGLAFCSDGTDRHYGFYPTAGSLRLTRFEGADVFSWTILADVRSDAYRPDDWNDLRVRVTPASITCFLNGVQVIESHDAAFRDGRAGLCKFRQTPPAFRQFRVGPDLTAKDEKGRDFYLEQARTLEENARRLRTLAAAAHLEAIERELDAVTASGKDDAPALVHAALVLARLDDADLDVEAYRSRIAALGADFRQWLGTDANALPPAQQVEKLNAFFFREQGFHGARFDYENRANSRLSEVLDDREGIPIQLCALYMAIGHAAGMDLVGLPREGQFVVGLRRADQPPLVIDVFEDGALLDEPDTAKLEPASNRAILTRMLRNLQAFAVGESSHADAFAYTSLILRLNPAETASRLARAALALELRRPEAARADLDAIDRSHLSENERRMLERLEAAMK